MEDKEFIAQMAQFSTLEQMTNMGAEFTKLSGILKSGQAFSLLGKTVEIISGEEVISGVVSEIAGREYPRVLVNGRYFDIEAIEKVRE
jgi:flagellar basal-body rod modification protein FlgD